MAPLFRPVLLAQRALCCLSVLPACLRKHCPQAPGQTRSNPLKPVSAHDPASRAPQLTDRASPPRCARPACRYLDDTIAHLRKGIAKAETPAKPKKGEAPQPAKKVRGALKAPAGVLPTAADQLRAAQEPAGLCDRRCWQTTSSPPPPCRSPGWPCMWPTALAAGTPRCWHAWRACLTRRPTASRRMPCSRQGLRLAAVLRVHAKAGLAGSALPLTAVACRACLARCVCCALGAHDSNPPTPPPRADSPMLWHVHCSICCRYLPPSALTRISPP